MIDELDSKILKILLGDARASFQEIAKKCNISSSLARIRFEKMKKTGVITGVITRINPKFFGHNYIALVVYEAESNSKEVYSFLQEIPGNILTVQCTGRYNFLSFFASKNIEEIAKTVEHIKEHPQITKALANILVSKTRTEYPENLIITPSDKTTCKKISLHRKERELKATNPNSTGLQAEKNDETPSYLDEIDIKIINLVAKDARIAFSEIGKRVGISTQAVSRRYNKMRQDVLPFSSVTLNLWKLGYEAEAIILVKTEKHKTGADSLYELTRIPNIIVAMKTLGTFDICLLSPVSSFEEFFELEQSIYAVEGVTRIEVLLSRRYDDWPRPFVNEVIWTQ